MRQITLTVNGEVYALEIPDHLTLVNLLRDRLGLTGTKKACEMGECGSCTVLLNGQAVCSCLTLAAAADGAEITTIEGLADPGGALHPVQAAFVEHHGLQCGACTPGMIMASIALLGENPDPTDADIKDALHGNICRCTGYQKIITSVRAAAASLRAGGESRG